LLTERNKEGYRAIDAGPVTMGYRLNNSREGFGITRRLIYPKGAYVLQMVRMMMYDRQSGDQRFKETMRDFVTTYAGQSATTEDFKAVAEKHMTPAMDLEGNHKMDWFFNEYVYGTQLPNYKFDYSFEAGPDGDFALIMKLNQSGVSPEFRMLVPIYLELANSQVVRLGSARPAGSMTVEQKVSLKGVKEKPKRAMINYNFDVLATMN
jgi:aminopeptidase N